MRPYILRRLKTDRRVIADLPDKTEVRAFCALTKEQAALYQQAVDDAGRASSRAWTGIERRGVVLAYADALQADLQPPLAVAAATAPSAPADSGKFARLRELCEPIAARQEQGARLHAVPRDRRSRSPRSSRASFGRPGLVLHGEHAGAASAASWSSGSRRTTGAPFFVLSLKAGGTGLNLTAASHVIHFDRWWNPAVENQATDRAFRIGQKKNVLVHKFVCRGTVEERIDALIESKQSMAKSVLEAGGEAILTEMSDEELLRVVALDLRAATEAA